MHADRANRIVLSLVGLIAFAIGLGGLLAAGGVFGHTFQHQYLVDNDFSRYVGKHGNWLWPAIAAVALVIVLLALAWLLRLLFTTDRSNAITVITPPRDKASTEAAAGRTTMKSAALTQAVTAEIDSYHGVTSSKARVTGDAAEPTLVLEVTASRRAELPALIERIEQQAITRARRALEKPELPVKLDITITDKAVARTD
jgi:hypothetical protein